MLKKIDCLEFDKLVTEGKGDVFVDFYADWCGPCQSMELVLEEISESETVYQVNIDEEQELAMENEIMSIPCIILFRDGKEVNRLIGICKKKEILGLKDGK